MIDRDFWPRPVAHLAGPYLTEADEHAVIAEIKDAPVNGYAGLRQLYSCIIPPAEVDAAIAAAGGIGWKVDSWGPSPEVPPEGGWTGSFWVKGAEGKGIKYEALVQGWHHHNRTVMVPRLE
jgi:hypothetical protein